MCNACPAGLGAGPGSIGGRGTLKKSLRALVGMAVIDVLLLAAAGWMVLQTRTGAWHAADPEAAVSAITATMGGAIGMVTAILLFAFFHHRRNGN